MATTRIGLDRTLRRPWLDQAALLAAELRNEKALRHALDTALTEDVTGPAAREKTVGILARTWWRTPPDQVPLRDEALAYAPGAHGDDRLLLHWGMLLLAHPVFGDTVSVMGRLLRLQGDFQLGQVSRRVAADWGNSPTLDFVVPRIVRSLRDWGVLVAQGDKGRHTAAAPISPSSRDVQLWLLAALLTTRRAETPVRDLLAAAEMFPFALGIGSGDVQRAPRFHVEARGQDLVVLAATTPPVPQGSLPPIS